MPELRIVSVAYPLETDLSVIAEAMHLISRSQHVGALESLPDNHRLDLELIGTTLHRLAALGVARNADASWSNTLTSDELGAVLRSANDGLVNSPMPETTWPVISSILGDSLLATALNVSEASVRRYSSGKSRTPNDVADRLHFLALIVSDLSGAYNDYGIRRWFTRRRSRLNNRTPLDLLSQGVSRQSPEADIIKGLVDSLVGAGAT